MKKLLLPLGILIGIGMSFAGIVQATTVFNSNQVGGGSPTSGFILQSAGNNTPALWVANTGGTGIGTTSPWVNGNVAYVNSNNTLTSAPTTTVSCSGNASCSSFTVIGSSPVTISATGGGGSGTGNVSTSTIPTIGNLAYWTTSGATPELLGKVATSSVSSGTGITFSGTAGALVGGSSLTVTNSGVISNSCPGGFLTCSGTNPSSFSLGTLGISNGGTNATSQTLGNIWYDGSKITSTSSAYTVGSFIGTTTATSTLAGGLQTLALNVTSTTATSTFANGINLAHGCYAIGGTCLSTGGGGSSQWTTNGTSIYYTGGNVGVGTSSPYSALSVSTTTQQNGILPLFTVASTTNASLFSINGNGQAFLPSTPIVSANTANLNLGNACGSLGAAVNGGYVCIGVPFISTDILHVETNNSGIFDMGYVAGVGMDLAFGANVTANHSFAVALGNNDAANNAEDVLLGQGLTADDQNEYVFGDNCSSANSPFGGYGIGSVMQCVRSSNSQFSWWQNGRQFWYIQPSANGNGEAFFAFGTTTDSLSNTSPSSIFTVQTPLQEPGALPVFTVASSSNMDLFKVLGAGNVDIATSSQYATLALMANNNYNLAIATTTGKNSFKIDNKGNQISGGDTPTVTCSPSGGSVVGDNTQGAVTTGTNSTSCTMTFADGGYPSGGTMECTADTNSTTIFSAVTSISNTAVTFSQAALTGTVYYHCGESLNK